MSAGGNDMRLGGAYIELSLDDAKIQSQLNAFYRQFANTRPAQPKIDFLNNLVPQFRAASEQSKALLANMQAFRRLSLGGADPSQLGFVDKYQAHNIRTQQGAALSGGIAHEKETQLGTLQQAVALEKARAKFAASPEGAKVIREQIKLQKELTAAKKATLAAEKAAVGPQAKEADPEQRQRDLKRFRSTMGYSFAAGTAGLTGLSAAASPAAFATLTGSIEMLSISIGQGLIPYLLDMSLYLQRTSRWIDTLSPSTKDWAAKLALTGVAIVGTAYAVSKLSQGFTALAAGIRVAGSAMAFLYANPAIAGLAALAIAVGAVGYAMSQNAEKTRYFTDRLNDLETSRKRLEAGGQAKTADIELLPPEAKAAIRQAQQSGDKKQMEATYKRLESESKATLEANPETDVDARIEKARRLIEGYAGHGSPERWKKLTEQLGNLGVPQHAIHPGSTILDQEISKLTGSPTPDLAARVEAALRMPVEVAKAQQAAARAMMLQGGIQTDEQKRQQLIISQRGLPQASFMDNQQLADTIQQKALVADTVEESNRQAQIRNFINALADSPFGKWIENLSDNSEAWKSYTPAWGD